MNSSRKLKIVCVAGARPNFMKISPLMNAFARTEKIESVLVHTGQHYDQRMSDLFFEQLKIPKPNINLGVSSGSSVSQMADMMKAFESACLQIEPDAVLVVGDVNSTVACGITAVKNGITLIHVEAGLRSFDRQMPEEINRILTDSISDLLFVSEPAGVNNLKREGVSDQKIFHVGNVMIDSLVSHIEVARQSNICGDLKLENDQYMVVTMHRPSNVDNQNVLTEIIETLYEIQLSAKIVFPIHPRTLRNIERFGLSKRIEQMPNLLLIEPLGYLEFLSLMLNARCILTDSGGVQEESTYLQLPCITARENTERPITVELGSNQLVGVNRAAILSAIARLNGQSRMRWGIPELWDGKASIRIAEVICDKLGRW